jgi:hypothetical protein
MPGCSRLKSWSCCLNCRSLPPQLQRRSIPSQPGAYATSSSSPPRPGVFLAVALPSRPRSAPKLLNLAPIPGPAKPPAPPPRRKCLVDSGIPARLAPRASGPVAAPIGPAHQRHLSPALAAVKQTDDAEGPTATSTGDPIQSLFSASSVSLFGGLMGTAGTCGRCASRAIGLPRLRSSGASAGTVPPRVHSGSLLGCCAARSRPARSPA